MSEQKRVRSGGSGTSSISTSKASVHWDEEGLEGYGDHVDLSELKHAEEASADDNQESPRRSKRSSSKKTKSKQYSRQSSSDLPGSASSIETKKMGTSHRSRSMGSGSGGSSTGGSSDSAGAASTGPIERAPSRYSVTELIAVLGNEKDTSELPPELERRVLDFRLAQTKRRETHGSQNRCGIYGMYAHLADLRIDLEWSEDAAWRRNHGHPYLSWSDFDKSRQGFRNRPWFTYFIIVLCTVMLLVEFGLNGWKVEPLSVNPLIGPSAQAMVNAGARVTPLIVNGGQWFRIFSPLFLHAGIIHYVINMLALWFIGGAVEQSHGTINAMVLFFIPGIGGTILSAIFLPHQISVGASGGIFGLIGGCIADIILNWKLLFIKTGEDDTRTRRRNISAIIWLIVDIVVNMLIGLTPYVDNFSHLGGLVYGLCCGFSTIEPLSVGFFGVQTTLFQKFRTVFIRFAGLIFSVVLIVATSAILATMDVSRAPCNNCRYLSCVPFPFGVENKWWYCDDCDYVEATLFKNDENDQYYSMIELTCPDGELEDIPIIDGMLADKEVIRRKLPNFCREHCESVSV